ncbi:MULTISPECIES: hypothetical protein [unclassified Streptomyces]|uniref:hypothetical protein n=1 Tax=unclassified Streptomyces TaxID=2593676 RepID=UPI00224EE96A|nr:MULTISPECIES: hypothetical protein [unclassified Streptomyces]WSP59708.1 hypothetical protein OG306_39315 [Streptomyces sp. NBC_01241]WSU19775.1 hypothetical protein OG508_01050 [Streptomyces sp. NBC_01108]MCX4791520.1 hypothetical protein [Streptomyces sp. NBC_01221]MCX4792777.1 hypothetical protein [Streptomyces sp. NBC_01242]WSP60701.1 hypothetical protein OG466_01135 [Streptomyces sp. NBC_01240]
MIKNLVWRGLPALTLAALPILAAVPAADAVENSRTVQSTQPQKALRSDSHFYGPATLGKNQAWTSGSGRTVLRVQSDGNVVVYKDNRPAWQAPNVYPNADRLVMQEDGNFVIYNRAGQAIWAAGTWHKGRYLAVQDDGNVVVYNNANQPVWATNTGD